MDFQNTNPYMSLAGISAEELGLLQQATAGLNDEQKKYFFMIYSGKRKSPQDMLIFCLIGTFLVPGFQRFMIGEIGMGILYLFTAGLCFIGSIVDLVNHKKLALEFNQKMAFESFNLAKMSH
ncbi:TM2 domain-containing protein [Mucilaginibacter sp. dw_454]|uniref:TM2 domain-containing protein n=1 Tax=Mucilaginibacter sp. dw_454 TaxID=2720079 RepID=UPI001BD4D659|nr:TM2 domain-containing protein [Mucilaginibacter sp. dw_454]